MASHLRVEREVDETHSSAITAGFWSSVCDWPCSDGPSLPSLPSTVDLIEQATQRLMQMRLAQPALMPDPHYGGLHTALGMMQLGLRESVVQFINEVRCPRPPAPSCPTPHPRLVLPAPGM